MSSDLIWELTKNQNAFLVRRNGISFCREKGNLTNINSKSASGLANHKAMDIRLSKEGGVAVSLKSSKKSNQRKPATQWNSVTHKGNFRRIAKTIRSQLTKYRPDLKQRALARFSALSRSTKTRVAKKRSRSGKRGAKKT